MKLTKTHTKRDKMHNVATRMERLTKRMCLPTGGHTDVALASCPRQESTQQTGSITT